MFRWLLLIALLLKGALFSCDYVIMTENFPPFNYERDKKVDGIAVEIVRHILRDLNQTDCQIELLPWARAYQTIQIRDNHVLFSMAKTEARANLFKWVGPIVTNGVYFFKKRDSNIKINSLEDAMKVDLIGVTRNTARHSFLVNRGFVNLDIANDDILNIRKLLLGRVSLIIGNEITTKINLLNDNQNLDAIEKVGFKLYDEELYIAFSKNVPDTEITRWQYHLDKLKTSGKLEEIKKRYLREFGLLNN